VTTAVDERAEPGATAGADQLARLLAVPRSSVCDYARLATTGPSVRGRRSLCVRARREPAIAGGEPVHP
jgi:hypothetical protein